MEPGCRDTATWAGPVGLRLGNHLYFDLADDADGHAHVGDERPRARAERGRKHDADDPASDGGDAEKHQERCHTAGRRTSP